MKKHLIFSMNGVVMFFEGIAQIQIIYDPGLILIGGGISSQGETLLKYIEPKIHHYLPSDYGIAKIQTTQTKNHAVYSVQSLNSNRI